MKSLLIAITIGMTMLLSGCAGVFLVGAGVGAGAFSYIAGNLTRVYEADYQKSVQASLNVMEQLNLRRKEESADELKTILEGYIYHDTPVTIQVVYVDALATQISVRTGYVGVENLEISEQVHADIAEEFKRLEPSPMGVASQKQKRPLDTPTLKATAKKQLYKTAGDKAEASESKGAPSPGSEIVSASLESDRDAPEDMKGRQKTLSPTLSESKSFVIYPKSELTIHAGSIGALGEVISFLDENQPVSVDIRAYTDSSGNFERNLALSQKRVSEIRNYLILHDIPDEIITAQILDETTFLENNRNEVQSPLPHRVEITIR